MKFSIQSLYTWYRDTLRNPKYRWWIIIGTFVYLLSPIDISPDFIPIAGQLDDVVVLTLLVSEVSQMLIDYAKIRKGSTVSDYATPTENTSTKTNHTVDVEAVSMK